MGKTMDEAFFGGILEECQELCIEKSPEIKSSHRKAFMEACEVFHEGFEEQKNATSDEEIERAAKNQQKAMKKCVKASTKIFEKLNMTKSVSLQNAILKGTVVYQATPSGLAEFCAEDRKHGKLIEHLLKEKDLMREMILNGGAKDGKYGQAMKIYTSILASFPEEEDGHFDVDKKIALAIALELCSTVYEFDTKVAIDPQTRFEHYSSAYKKGELDPAFPHFSVWELRHVVNCDGKNDQIQWARNMMMTYCPYITTLTDPKTRYNYILETDVLMRNPTWTSSPRTYQQVLSGGGKETIHAWFGRFILKAFGIPVWGCKLENGREGYTMWTREGWATKMKADWDTCEWKGVSGIDFKGEADARSANTDDEYYRKLVLLEHLADVLDSRRGVIPEEERMILHPLRTWRSLAILQKALMLEPSSPDTFERTGEGVKTNTERYLEMFEQDKPDDKIKNKNGVVTVPGGATVSKYGSVMVIASFKGGKQVNFVADGHVDFDIPDNIESNTYKVTLEVCSVHLKQTPLFLSVESGDRIPIKIPYTSGAWKVTEAVEAEISGGDTLSFIRERPSFGLAIKKIVLTS